MREAFFNIFGNGSATRVRDLTGKFGLSALLLQSLPLFEESLPASQCPPEVPHLGLFFKHGRLHRLTTVTAGGRLRQFRDVSMVPNRGEFYAMNLPANWSWAPLRFALVNGRCPRA